MPTSLTRSGHSTDAPPSTPAGADLSARARLGEIIGRGSPTGSAHRRLSSILFLALSLALTLPGWRHDAGALPLAAATASVQPEPATRPPAGTGAPDVTSPAESATAAAPDRRGLLFERWYTLTIHDQQAGYMRVRQDRFAADAPAPSMPNAADAGSSSSTGGMPAGLPRATETGPDLASSPGQTDPTDRIHTRSETRLRMARGATVISIELATEFVERADGRPLEMWSYQKMSEQAVETTYRFDGDRIGVYRGERPGPGVEREPDEWVDAPKDVWLTPVEAGRHMQRRIAESSRWMSYRTLDPAYGVSPVTIRRRLVNADTSVEHDGTSIPATEWRVWQSSMPEVPSVEMLDAEGNLLLGRSNLGGLVEMTMRISDATVADHAGPAPELLVSTFVRPDQRIVDPRRTTRAEYVLSVDDGRLDDLPSGVGGQVSKRIDRQRIRVTVDARRSQAASPEDAGNGAYLRSSSFIDHQHPRVLEVANAAVAGLPRSASPAQRAEALRTAVLHHITNKNLAKGFAAASEAAIDRAGDCTEHAVLLAALLRAQQIPARLVAGLVYVDSFEGERDVFGYHMWTQALIDGRWVDYDATMQRRFDATHIALIDAALEDDNVAARMTPMLPLLGRLRIEVVDQDRTGSVGAEAMPWAPDR